MADLFATLMTEVLGYPRFCAQGGDIGAQVTARLAAAYPQHLYGIHLNFLGLLRDVSQPGQPTPEEAQYLAQVQHWLTEEVGISGSRARNPRRWRMASPTPRSAWPPGSSRSSGAGVTVGATSNAVSPRMSS